VPADRIGAVGIVCKYRRPLVLGLAAVVFSAGAAFTQGAPLAERIETCSACHGEDGNSSMENIPSIAGQPAFFIVNQLILMREKVRPVEAMEPFVKDLKDEEATALAAHFAKLLPKPSDEKVDPALVKRGEAIAAERRCGSCHLPTLAGQEQIPRVAGQRVDYLIKSLKEFRDGTRLGADTNMSVPVAGLSDSDLAALAHYAASR
jgi:cytochrome c553